MSRERLRDDFRFAVLVIFCAVGVLGVGPFALYRVLGGEWPAAVVDMAIVAALLGALAHAWRGGDVERTSVFVVAAGAAGCAIVSRLDGLAGVFWSYPVIVSSFMLAARRRALVVSLLLVAVVALGGTFPTQIARLLYGSAALVTCLIGFVFARRTDLQRARLERLASRDPLTGAANRRAMARELHIAAEAFRRHRMPVGLLVMDLDHFKRINDELGHEAGDSVLVDFARLVQSRCRAGDRLFRYGGEEFVLLLPGTDVDDLHALADALRRAVASSLRTRGRGVTMSVGGAVLRSGEDTAQWLARADVAMYKAKREGRDRVVVDDSPQINS